MNTRYQGTGVVKSSGRVKRVDPKFIPREDAESIIAAISPKYITGLRNRLMIELMYKTGMRVSEVCNLKRRQLHVDDNWMIEIREGKTGDRTLEVPTSMRPLMETWLDRRVKELPRSAWLFPTHSGASVNRNYVNGVIERVCRRVGIEKTHAHIFRHTFAHYFLEDGGSVSTLQEILGHTTPTMSLFYSKASAQDARKALRNK